MSHRIGKPSVVLLVDDDFNFLELVAQQLEGHDIGRAFQVYIAADGMEAMAQIASLQRIDVLVTDLNMPKADGLAVTLTFRGRYPEGAVVLTTAAASADDRIASILKLSPSAMLRKPFSISALVEKLRAINPGIVP